MAEEVVIFGAARTPIGKFMGALAGVPAPQLGAAVIRAAVQKAGVPLSVVDEVIMGNVISAGLGQAPARQAAIGAGIPSSASATTVNKVCASGLQAVQLAAQAIATGDARVVVAGGMENMSGGPHVLRGSRVGLRLGNGELLDATVYDGLWCAFENHHMGNSAEAIADKYSVTRAEQDAFALESHRKAVAAWERGAFLEEIVPVEVVQRREKVVVHRDECPRTDTTMEVLSRLAPAFKEGGTVTAGNAPGITDGAAALVLASASVARELGASPIARVTGFATVGVDPLWLFDAPPLAVRRLLEKTGLRLEDFDLVEVNEAFSAQVLANERALHWDRTRVNVNGGAVALGHPIGASGARILVTLLYALRHRALKTGLATLCHGGGGAVAMSVEMI